MKVMSELGKYAPNAVFFSLFLGSFAGICYIALIPLVLLSVEQVPGLQYEVNDLDSFLGFSVSNGKIAFVFFLLCISILLMRTVSQILLNRVSVMLTSEIRKRIYHSIVNAPVDILERIGSSKIVTSLTTDVNLIVAGASAVPSIFINSVTVVGMLFYIWFVNANVFYSVAAALFFGAITYQIPMFISGKYYSKARISMDELQESFRAIVYGAKEFKLNNFKRNDFVDKKLSAVEAEIKSNKIKADVIAVTAANYGDMISFFLVGCLSFVFLNYYQVSTSELIAVIMIMLYMAGPVSLILFSIPVLIQANVSYSRMDLLFNGLVDEGISMCPAVDTNWNELSLKNVTYSYDDADGFKIGPVNLTVRKGEITFIVGGNGSGKSTFSKIITLHYYPKSGDVFFDDIKVDKNNINGYRQCISSIYSDYYLFDSLYGIDCDQSDLKKRVDQLLVELGLDEKVTFDNGHFSTVKLSDGQRRRLALLVAFIEDKELYLFDEWAADQDPVFRDVYYAKILPQLKERGKAVVAISHDDRYFHVADKIIKLESGVQIQ